MPDVIEGTAVEVPDDHHNGRGREIVPAAPAPALTVTPQVEATELVRRLEVIKEAQQNAMVRDVDYGVVPGTDKPTLLKPGAEKLTVLFQLDVQLDNEKIWGPGDHLTVLSHATVFHAPTGARLGYGEGLCTTREKKYAKRMADRACPECGKTTIKRSKFAPRGRPNDEPGWYCFAKIGGCGADFAATDERITGQEAGEVDNPDLPDLWNTVVKMAEKRARVDAVLAVTGASALFTQDVEDTPGADHPPSPPSREPQPSRVTARQPQATERTASAKQRGLINAKAGEAALVPAQLANVVLVAAGQPPRTFDSDEHAQRFVSRQLDRLPARLVDAVLEGIQREADAA